jgi:hypothetical protein
VEDVSTPDDVCRPAEVSPTVPSNGPWGRRVVVGTAQWTPWVLVALAGAYGVLIRLWLLVHLPLFGDEAVVGLMGRGILNGRLDAFYWGQSYGGAEPYVVAAVLGPFNGGPMGLNATPAILAAVASLLAYGVLRSGGASRRLSALGGAMVWVWPYAATWNSVREIGFRGATLCCGLLLVLCCVRVFRHRAGPTTRVLLGLAVGTGWWASPEIVYFVLPALLLLVASWERLFQSNRWVPPWRVAPLLLTLGGAVIGALPWIHSNIRSRLSSLHLGTPPPPGFGYSKRLSIFFHDVLPSQLGLRTLPGGAWVGGNGVGHTLFAIVLVLLALMLVRVIWTARLGRAVAPLLAAGLAVVTFPFLYAFFPTSWYWADGRYGVYLPPLLVLLAVWSLPSAMAATKPAVPTVGRHTRHTRHLRPVAIGAALALASAGLVVGAVSTVATAHESAGIPTHPGTFFAGWSDPNQAARHVVRAMTAHHIRAAYGDYWTAYTLDFLGPHAVTVSPSPLDPRRSVPLARAVAGSRAPAWLFFAPEQEAEAASAFSNPEPGPGGYTEGAFIAYLKAQNDGYRVIRLGVLDAVVPNHVVHHLPALG